MLILKPNSDNAKIALILFPYAGGTGEYYYQWLDNFDSTIEAQYARLPGRGCYLLKHAYDDIMALCKVLTEEVIALGNSKIAFFGHSMGALIAFELAKMLYNKHTFQVKHLFLSGHRAPCLPYDRTLLHKLPINEFFEKLIDLGGIPEKTKLSDLQSFIPTLYRDFALCERYSYTGKTKLPIPITLFYGRSDPWIQADKLNLWQVETPLPISIHTFDGGHFYLHNHAKAIIDIINKNIRGI